MGKNDSTEGSEPSSSPPMYGEIVVMSFISGS